MFILTLWFCLGPAAVQQSPQGPQRQRQLQHHQRRLHRLPDLYVSLSLSRYLSIFVLYIYIYVYYTYMYRERERLYKHVYIYIYIYIYICSCLLREREREREERGDIVALYLRTFRSFPRPDQLHGAQQEP